MIAMIAMIAIVTIVTSLIIAIVMIVGDYRASLTRVWALFLYSEIFSGFISPPLGASWECAWMREKVQA